MSNKVFRYLVIVARYLSVRVNRDIVEEAVLVIATVTEDGYREILAVDIAELKNRQPGASSFFI